MTGVQTCALPISFGRRGPHSISDAQSEDHEDWIQGEHTDIVGDDSTCRNMGEETSALRSLLTPRMLETLGRNYSRNVENVRAYEIGNTFVKNLIEPDKLPDEAYNLRCCV